MPVIGTRAMLLGPLDEREVHWEYQNQDHQTLLQENKKFSKGTLLLGNTGTVKVHTK